MVTLFSNPLKVKAAQFFKQEKAQTEEKPLGTSCFIGKFMPSGIIRYIKCALDGYLVGTGFCLVSNYASEFQVDSLLDRGNVRGVEIFLNITEQNTNIDTHNGVTSYSPPARSVTFDVFQDLYRRSTNRFVYLFKDDEWYVASREGDGPSSWTKFSFAIPRIKTALESEIAQCHLAFGRQSNRDSGELSDIMRQLQLIEALFMQRQGGAGPASHARSARREW